MRTSAKDLLHFLETVKDGHFVTLARQRGFCVRPLPDGIEITPDSSGESRQVPLERIQQFCDEFDQCGSLNPSDYKDVTFDASYLITILDSYRRDARCR